MPTSEEDLKKATPAPVAKAALNSTEAKSAQPAPDPVKGPISSPAPVITPNLALPVVCLVIGMAGSGKTTLLQVRTFKTHVMCVWLKLT